MWSCCHFPTTALLRISQHPINARHANIQATCDLSSLQTFASKSDNTVGFGSCRCLPPFVFPVSLGLRHAFPLAFKKEATLEFRDGSQHRDHQLAGWRTSIDLLTAHTEHDETD